MDISYSTYEAKARFAEVLRHVRQGGTVTVLYRGEPVAQIRPVPRGEPTIEERLDGLRQRGVLTGPVGAQKPIAAVQPRPGALARFLSERNG